MADNVTIKSEPESKGEETSPVAETQKASLTPSHLTSLCAIGLLVSFFLPWANFLLATLSGFDLQKLDDSQKLLWLIPFFCVTTLVGGLTGKGQKLAAQVTGALPFCALAFWIYQLRGDLFSVLSYGAYLSLILGAALIIVPTKMK